MYIGTCICNCICVLYIVKDVKYAMCVTFSVTAFTSVSYCINIKLLQSGLPKITTTWIHYKVVQENADVHIVTEDIALIYENNKTLLYASLHGTRSYPRRHFYQIWRMGIYAGSARLMELQTKY